jgi:hypothetical protein
MHYIKFIGHNAILVNYHLHKGGMASLISTTPCFTIIDLQTMGFDSILAMEPPTLPTSRLIHTC